MEMKLGFKSLMKLQTVTVAAKPVLSHQLCLVCVLVSWQQKLNVRAFPMFAHKNS